VTEPVLHPDAETLAQVLIGDCSPGTAHLVERHVALCARCRATYLRLGGPSPQVSEPRGHREAPLAGAVVATAVSGMAGLGEAVFEIMAGAGAVVHLTEAFALGELLVLSGAITCGAARFRKGDFLSAPQLGKATTITADGAVRMLVTAQVFPAVSSAEQFLDIGPEDLLGRSH
jgi:hypothetical protein